MLYLSHADWRWIKQRPQFLAEALAREGWRVTVAYAPAVRRRRMVSSPTTLSPVPVPLIPRWAAYWARAWNGTVGRLAITILRCAVRPDVIWVTHPGLGCTVGNGGAAVVYDAMDLTPEFHSDGRARDEAAAQERRICERASIIFASSSYIERALSDFGPDVARKVHRLPNGFDGDRDWSRFSRIPDGAYRLTYVGTISEWVDMDILERVVEAVPNAEVLLVGPTDRASSEHPRIRYGGVIPHAQLPRLAKVTDCFLLPFKLTELVRGVDPVKLYEYVAMERPVIARWYPELEKFKGLVHFYEDHEGFESLVRSRPSPASAEAAARFLERSTWDQRGIAASTQLADRIA